MLHENTRRFWIEKSKVWKYLCRDKNKGFLLKFVIILIIWQESCFTSCHVLVVAVQMNQNHPFLFPGLLQAQNLLTQLPQQSQANLLQSQPSITLASQVRLISTVQKLLWGGHELLRVRGLFVLVTGVNAAKL